MNISIELHHDRLGKFVQCNIPLQTFELIASKDFSYLDYQGPIHNYLLFHRFARAVGVFKEVPSDVRKKDRVKICLSFHNVKPPWVDSRIAQYTDIYDRVRETILRARDLCKKILPLRNTLYDTKFIARPRDTFAKSQNYKTYDVITSLTNFTIERGKDLPDIVYDGITLSLSKVVINRDPIRVQLCIEMHIKRINRKIAMLRCIAAIEQVNTQLFERHVLEIVKAFM